MDFVLVYYEKVSKFVFIPTCFNNFIFHKWQNVFFSFCCVQEICTTQAHLQSKMSHNQIKDAISLMDNRLEYFQVNSGQARSVYLKERRNCHWFRRVCYCFRPICVAPLFRLCRAFMPLFNWQYSNIFFWAK